MPNFPGGCTSAKQFSNYVHERVKECIMRYMSKEQTARHLRDRYQIVYGCTEIAWCNLERLNPAFFRTYFSNGAPNATALARMAKQTAIAQIKEGTGSCKTPNSSSNGDSDKAASLFSDTRGREEEQKVMPQKAAYPHDGNPIVSVEQISSKARESEKQTLQASQQQPTAEFWQKLLNTLGRIQSNTDQMVKLLTDDAPHPCAAGSFKRQRVEPEKERSEAEKLQQNQNIQQTHGQYRGIKAAKIH